MPRILLLSVLLAWVSTAACVPIENAGGLTESHGSGVVSQASIDDGPVEVSQKRRGQLEESGLPVSETAQDGVSPQPSSIPGEAVSTASESESTGVEADETGTEAVAAGSESAPVSASPDAEVSPEAVEEAPLPEIVPSAASDSPETTEAEVLAETEGAEETEEAEDSSEELVETPIEVEEPAVEEPEVEEPEVSEPAAEPLGNEGRTEPEPEPAEASVTATPVKRKGEDLVAEGPASDQDALAAIDRMPRRKAPPAANPDFGGSVIPPAERCEATVAPVETSRSPLFQLHMTKWGMEGEKPFAILAPKAGGQEFRIDVGDRLGPNGGLVVEIKSDQVIVHVLRLDPAGESTTVQEVIRLK